MKVFVTAKPNAHEERIEQIDATHFDIRVKEPAVDDKANRAIVKAVARYFSVPPSAVSLLRGHSGRHKILDVAC